MRQLRECVDLMESQEPSCHDLLLNLAHEDEVGGCAGERGRAADTCGVAHTQTQAFGQAVVLVLHHFLPEIQRVLARVVWSHRCLGS